MSETTDLTTITLWAEKRSTLIRRLDLNIILKMTDSVKSFARYSLLKLVQRDMPEKVLVAFQNIIETSLDRRTNKKINKALLSTQNNFLKKPKRNYDKLSTKDIVDLFLKNAKNSEMVTYLVINRQNVWHEGDNPRGVWHGATCELKNLTQCFCKKTIFRAITWLKENNLISAEKKIKARFGFHIFLIWSLLVSSFAVLNPKRHECPSIINSSKELDLYTYNHSSFICDFSGYSPPPDEVINFLNLRDQKRDAEQSKRTDIASTSRESLEYCLDKMSLYLTSSRERDIDVITAFFKETKNHLEQDWKNPIGVLIADKKRPEQKIWNRIKEFERSYDKRFAEESESTMKSIWERYQELKGEVADVEEAVEVSKYTLIEPVTVKTTASFFNTEPEEGRLFKGEELSLEDRLLIAKTWKKENPFLNDAIILSSLQRYEYVLSEILKTSDKNIDFNNLSLFSQQKEFEYCKSSNKILLTENKYLD